VKFVVRSNNKCKPVDHGKRKGCHVKRVYFGDRMAKIFSEHSDTRDQQFPIQQSTIANPNLQSLDAKYYTLQAQTALAARSASEHDYNNIQTQLIYL
jgi:hypothetical protein